MKSSSRLLLLSALFLFACHGALAQSIPVFPGATGYGTQTVAGRGTVGVSGSTTVYKVTLLTDSNPSVVGELRYGVETVTGPRVIIFEVSGVIELHRVLTIRNSNPFITIAGQTAPAPGITLKNAGINVQSHDVLVQHIAIRPGKRPKGAAGAGWNNWEFLPPISNRKCILINVAPGNTTHNVVFDHVSVSWGTDENVTIGGANDSNGSTRDITVSNSFVYEALRHAGHPDDVSIDGHSAGFLVYNAANRVSVARNVLAFNRWRNPLITEDAIDVRVVNNFVYAPGQAREHRIAMGSVGTGPVRESMDGNVIILHQDPTAYGYGTNATQGVSISVGAPEYRLFLNNNRLWHPTYSGNWVPSTPPFNPMLVYQGTPATPLATDELVDDGVASCASLTADQVEDALLGGSGARAGVRDLSDARLKAQIDARTLRDWTDSPESVSRGRSGCRRLSHGQQHSVVESPDRFRRPGRSRWQRLHRTRGMAPRIFQLRAVGAAIRSSPRRRFWIISKTTCPTAGPPPGSPTGRSIRSEPRVRLITTRSTRRVIPQVMRIRSSPARIGLTRSFRPT